VFVWLKYLRIKGNRKGLALEINTTYLLTATVRWFIKQKYFMSANYLFLAQSCSYLFYYF